MARRRDAGSSMDVHADVPAAGQERLARVQAHANAHRQLLKGSLPVACGGGGLARSGEDDEERVALGVDLYTFVALEHLPEKISVPLELNCVRTRARFGEERGRPLDVGEEKGHGARWARRHTDRIHSTADSGKRRGGRSPFYTAFALAASRRAKTTSSA